MQTLVKLNNRFYYQTPVSETDRPILGVVIGSNRSLMIDAGNSTAHAEYFLEELRNHKITIPDIVVLTHWHWDHIFGLSNLDMLSIASLYTKNEVEKLIPYEWTDSALEERVCAGVEIEFCADAIKEEYEDNRNIIIKLPDLVFETKMEIDLGGVSCILEHVGGDHASDSTIVYIKEEKILFLGDSIYPDIYSSKRNYTSRNTLQLLDLIDKYDAETYILSHWKPISKKEYEQEATLLKTIANLSDKYPGDFEAIRAAYQRSIDRDLNDEELETIEYFVNGVLLNK